jgi:transposase-like protein
MDTKVCFECNSIDNIHQHHIIPKSLGGIKTIPLCNSCHGKVHQKDFVKFHHLAQLGRERYKANGGKFGRKVGSMESVETFMEKPINKEIAKLVEQGYSVRKISSILKASTKTVVKVRKIMGISTPPTITMKKPTTKIQTNFW